MCWTRSLAWTLVATLPLLGCRPPEPPAPSASPSAEKAADRQPAPARKQVSAAPEKPAPSLRLADPAVVLPDFARLTRTAEKKAAFFSFLRPIVRQENDHARQVRTHLKYLRERLQRQSALKAGNQAWLKQLAALYRVEASEPAEQIKRLLLKISPLPESLVLAQAANESGWGTSRFARKGNNLFGQWCFTPGCGIAPLGRAEDATHEVARYPSVAAGVRAYFININSHPGYAELRQIRRCLEDNNRPVSGRALAAGLTRYSARGDHYVKELRAMIRHNELEPWQRDWWGHNSDQPCAPLVQVTLTEPDPLRVSAEESNPQPPTQSVPTQPVPIQSVPTQAATAPPAAQQTPVPLGSAGPASQAPAAGLFEPRAGLLFESAQPDEPTVLAGPVPLRPPVHGHGQGARSEPRRSAESF